MKAKDLREKSLEDLRELEKTTAHDVFQNRFKNFTNRLDDTSAIKKSRRLLARIRTVLVERAVAAPAAPAAEVKAAEAPAAKPKKAAAKKSASKAQAEAK